ncbi:MULTISPECIES: hypothetical protein [Azospirillum]|uniref:Uncharacterized protein n=1 Tax=Azospirillum brasilense TaxID=192 RepID=A0A4D8Q689_AZOBR|nr:MULTISPECIES: hypothetical protein [Azospirillum]QCO03049.1 hypothetical protein D3867_14125 [Azospirillum argentinense]QCO18882.1 hypothetical protein D3869_26810 [Azospirillum brasilense]
MSKRTHPPFCSSPPLRRFDTLTEEGARRLATQIKAAWAKVGYDVKTSVERGIGLDGVPGGYFVVRSDLFRGMPRRRFPQGAA